MDLGTMEIFAEQVGWAFQQMQSMRDRGSDAVGGDTKASRSTDIAAEQETEFNFGYNANKQTPKYSLAKMFG